MKIEEVQSKPFKPVTITLESREEVMTMDHIIYCRHPDSQENCTQKQEIIKMGREILERISQLGVLTS